MYFTLILYINQTEIYILYWELKGNEKINTKTECVAITKNYIIFSLRF